MAPHQSIVQSVSGGPGVGLFRSGVESNLSRVKTLKHIQKCGLAEEPSSVVAELVEYRVSKGVREYVVASSNLGSVHRLFRANSRAVRAYVCGV